MYEPRENGLVERFNRVLKGYVSDSIKMGGNWRNTLREKLWSYRIPSQKSALSSFLEVVIWFPKYVPGNSKRKQKKYQCTKLILLTLLKELRLNKTKSKDGMITSGR